MYQWIDIIHYSQMMNLTESMKIERCIWLTLLLRNDLTHFLKLFRETFQDLCEGTKEDVVCSWRIWGMIFHLREDVFTSEVCFCRSSSFWVEKGYYGGRSWKKQRMMIDREWKQDGEVVESQWLYTHGVWNSPIDWVIKFDRLVKYYVSSDER